MIYLLSFLGGLLAGIIVLLVCLFLGGRLIKPRDPDGNTRWGLIWALSVAAGVVTFFIILIFAPVPFIIYANIFTDHLWFSSIGFHSVWARRISTQWYAFGAGTLAAFLFLFANAWLAKRLWPKLPPYNYGEKGAPEDVPGWHISELLKAIILWIVMIFASLGFGLWMNASWKTILLFFNGVSFGEEDPVFGRDIGFYVFDLPFWNFLNIWFFILLLVAVCVVVLLHAYYHGRTYGLESVYRNLAREGEEPAYGEPRDTYYSRHAGKVPAVNVGKCAWHAATVHGSILLAFLFVVAAMWAFLNRFELVLAKHGDLLTGANVTDIEVRDWTWLLFAAVCLLGIVILLPSFVNKLNIIVSAGVSAILVFVSLIVFVLIVPAVYQGIEVGPNQLELERTNIGRHIKATRTAFGIDAIEETPYPVADYLTQETATENQATLDNVRIQDWRTLLAALNPLQALRTYYNFQDVDIDRMEIDGQMRQIMISPRDLNLSGSDTPKGWINGHFIYTHGHSVTISPVNEVAQEGLPKFLVKDIPFTGADIGLTRPEIYFSTHMSGWVIVNSKQEEFDYPSGEENVFTMYEGEDGVDVGTLDRRFAFGIRTGNFRLFLRSPIKEDSKIILYRSIEDRVQKIAPFLRYDADPYIAVVDGRLVWIWDAYTTTDNYPYSRHTAKGFNYIRGSVKVVIDAYDGDVTFYQIDAEDPIIRTWAKIFPDLFTPVSEAPASLQAHFRYPEELLNAQARTYTRYHVQNPTTFYNKEDFWSIPNEIFAGSQLSQAQAYYVYAKLPGETEPEFILMQSFTPRSKQNAIAWLAGRSDPSHYGKLIAFRFPKTKLIFGPQQVEARIDQNTQLSKDISLWDTRGSRVIRGNLLMLPVGDTIVYFEPLYIQAVSEEDEPAPEEGVERKTAEDIENELTGGQTAIPELKRVIVVNNDHLVVANSLPEAINQLLNFEEAKAPPIVSGQGAQVPEEQREAFKEILGELLTHQAAAQQAAGEGDWVTFGEEMNEANRLLKELEALTE